MLLWPCGHKDQSFLAFWYKSKQDIFKEVKIQMKKKIFKKTFVAVCQIHCHIHCWIQSDNVENVNGDKFGYSSLYSDDIYFQINQISG